MYKCKNNPHGVEKSKKYDFMTRGDILKWSQDI